MPLYTSIAVPSGLEEKIREMRSRLLDLSGRNLLLRFRFSPRRSLRFIEGDMAFVFAELGGGRRLPILGLPVPPAEKWIAKDGRKLRPDAESWARSNNIPVGHFLPPGAGLPFRALAYDDDLAVRCRHLQREAELGIEETGAHRLHLVLGFLDLPGGAKGAETWLAPLVCVPVALRIGQVEGRTDITIEAADDAIADNAALREKLKQDLNLELPSTPEWGGDLESYYGRMLDLSRRNPVVRLRREAALCLMSFTRARHYADLAPERWPGIGEHALLQKLFGREVEGECESAGGGSNTADLPLILEADSSQVSALTEAVGHRRSVAIEGAPGTGKSQTIANFIAGAMAAGESVLFVAEKQASLDAVAERLRRAGLGPFLLPLYGAEANLAAACRSLRERLEWKCETPVRFAALLAAADWGRRQLHDYQAALRSSSGNRLGLTLHELVWLSERERFELAEWSGRLAGLEPGNAAELDSAHMREAEECVADMGAHVGRFGDYGPSRTFWGFQPGELGAGAVAAVACLLQANAQACADFAVAAGAYAQIADSAPGLTPGAAQTALASLRQLSPRIAAKPLLPIMPALLAAGERVEPALAALESEIAGNLELKAVAEAGLKREAPEAEPDLARLQRAAARYKVRLGTASQIAAWQQRLREKLEVWNGVMGAMASACKPLGWKLEHLGGLESVLRFAEAGASAPGNAVRFQSSLLFEPEAERALGGLAEAWIERDQLASELKSEIALHRIVPGLELDERVDQLQRRGWLLKLSREYRAARRWLTTIFVGEKPPRPKRIRMLAGKLERWARRERELAESPARQRYLPPVVEFTLELIEHLRLLAAWNQNMVVALAQNGLRWEFTTIEEAQSLVLVSRRLLAIGGDARAVLAELQPLAPGLDRTQPLAAIGDGLRDLAEAAGEPASWLERFAAPGASLEQVIEALRARSELRRRLASLPRLDFLGGEDRGFATDIAGARHTLTVARDIAQAALPDAFRRRLLEDAGRAGEFERMLACIARGFEAVARLEKQLEPYGSLDGVRWAGAAAEDDVAKFAKGFHQRLERASNATDELSAWRQLSQDQERAERLRLRQLSAELEARGLPAPLWRAAYRYLVFRALARQAFHAAPELEEFAGGRRERALAEWRRAERECLDARGAAIAAELVARNRVAETGPGARSAMAGEMRRLEHALAEADSRVSLREFLHAARTAIRALKPCFLMSPDAVARLLPAATELDVVVMDEASRIAVEEAVGALARARRALIVGDTRQLPPEEDAVRFAEGGVEIEAGSGAPESVLDLAVAQLPRRVLRFHYRSRHESLIAFANRHFYDGKLEIVAARGGHRGESGLRAEYLAQGYCQDQRNSTEATRIVELALRHVHGESRSLGIIALTAPQRDCIAELLDRRLLRDDTAAAWLRRQHEAGRPLFVKSVENVQGEERDVILVSATFGRSPGAGTVRQNFGALGREGGWRRLNVLLTRARGRMVVVTSMRPEDIVVDAATPRGVRLLSAWLESMRGGDKGTAPLPRHDSETPVEEVVARVLRQAGYEAAPQAAAGQARFELAVHHPDAPDAILAVVAGDGVPEDEAGAVNGPLWPIWSTDWFRDPAAETQRLLEFLAEARRNWTPDSANEARWSEAPVDWGAWQREPMVMPRGEEDESARIGDTVRYVDLSRPEVERSTRIVETSEEANAAGPGCAHAGTELAQALLGAVAGDDVVLREPGTLPQTLRVLTVIHPLAALR